MELPRVRPRFRLSLREGSAGAIDRMRRRFEQPDAPVLGRIVGEHVDLAIPEADRHLWSPCMHLELGEREAGTVVNGLIGPQPGLWTMFAFSYITLLSSAFFALILGFVQLTLDEPPWGLWAVAPIALLVAALFWMSQIGQRLAADQMNLLRSFVEESLRDVIVESSCDSFPIAAAREPRPTDRSPALSTATPQAVPASSAGDRPAPPADFHANS